MLARGKRNIFIVISIAIHQNFLTHLIIFVCVVSDFDSLVPVALLSKDLKRCIALIVSSSSPFLAGWSSLALNVTLLPSCVKTIGIKSWPADKIKSKIFHSLYYNERFYDQCLAGHLSRHTKCQETICSSSHSRSRSKFKFTRH